MKIKNPEKRLEMFWGKVDQKHISLIARYCYGNYVLDLGCGYGTTTHAISKNGYHCIGIDYDEVVIEEAKSRFPLCEFQKVNAESLPFENEFFDTIVLRDALHHFYKESNFDNVKYEILRVLKKKGSIIIFDPNINFMLRSMRKLSFHKDEECSFEIANDIIIELGFDIIYSGFNTIFSLPLSGGYIGINFIPNFDFIHSWILSSEKIIEKCINWIGLGRYLGWRYLIVGKRKDSI